MAGLLEVVCYAQHLVTNDDARKSLNNVFGEQPSVDLLAHLVVHNAGHALPDSLLVVEVTVVGKRLGGWVVVCSQERILQIQAVGHPDAELRVVPQRAECSSASHFHLVEQHVHLAPEHCDAKTGVAVHADDALALVVGQIDRRAHGTGAQRVLELGPAHAVAQTQHGDLADEALVLADILDGDAVDLRGHVLVDVLAFAKELQQLVVASEPRCHARLDLRRVSDHDDVALGGDDRLAQLTAALEVLQVHLVPCAPSSGMSPEIVKVNRQPFAVSTNCKEPLSARFTDCGLGGEPACDELADAFVVVSSELQEFEVGFAERPRCFVCPWRDFRRWGDTQSLERIGELVRGRENFERHARLFNELGALVLFLPECYLDTRDVDSQHWVAEHAYGQIDEI